MSSTDFQAKLTAVINAEPDPDVTNVQFWHEFMRHDDILSAAPDPSGVIALCISAAAGRDIERITCPWETIRVDFSDKEASVWADLAQRRQIRSMLGHGDWGPPPRR